MAIAQRQTIVTYGRFSMKEARLAAAREGRHGLQVMSVEQLAARLAGGFHRQIDDDKLREAIQASLLATPMGELEGIKTLPGMTNAAFDTLKKAWDAGIDLAKQAGDHPRLEAIAGLETAILARLPSGMSRPAEMVEKALARLTHAPAILGDIEVRGMTELAPCWRQLLIALANHVRVTWLAGPRSVPGWLAGTAVVVTTSAAQDPVRRVVSAATALHEAVEAMRWARHLLSSGAALASEIAIAAASPADYDNHLLALRADANFDLHFVHGIPVVATREGQAAAALGDILVRGVSQTRLRRLASLCRESRLFTGLPEQWMRVLPRDAPLSSARAWTLLLGRLTPADWPDGSDHAPALRELVETLQRGPEAADEIGEAFLARRALAIWRKALIAGPASSIDVTLEKMRQEDGLEACVSMAWMPASALASSPRRFVRLLGLNSSRWPRNISEDRLIPDHVIRTSDLDPLPINLADRRDFETILRTTAVEVVLSRARRDSEGRLLGRSALLPAHDPEAYLRRTAVPSHAFSESDRLNARPTEFSREPQAESANGCWTDWLRPEATSHDGLVSANHPLVRAILSETQSASSLRRLLRNPLGYLWKYGLGWRAPESSEEPLILDALSIGNLVHEVLDQALQDLEASGGLSAAAQAVIHDAANRAAEAVAVRWERNRAVPPSVIWRQTLQDARMLASTSLSFGQPLAGGRSYSEVPFGGATPKSGGALPWDANAVVTIPGAGFNISGYIDRIDLAADGSTALVRDYKTGRAPRENIRLNGGRELQRCLYGFAVRALLGDNITISASLLYAREPRELLMDDANAALHEISEYLQAANTSLAGGAALPGPDAGDAYDELAFALPANSSATYLKRKLPDISQRLAGFASVWEVE